MQKIRVAVSKSMLIELEGADAKEVIIGAAFWTTLPQACPVCDTPVVLFYRNPQGFDFYGLRCTGPVVHETNFGQFKDANMGLWYKGVGSWQQSQINWGSPEGGDAQHTGQPSNQKQPAQSNGEITAAQLSAIRNLASRTGADTEGLARKKWNCGLEEVTAVEASQLIKHLQTLPTVNPVPPAKPAPQSTDDDIPF